MTEKIYYVFPRLDDYDAISFYKDGELILVLGVSGTAQADASCGLGDVDVDCWLWEVGNSFIDELKETQKLIIKYTNVVNGELTTHWSNLDKLPD
ncbi:MULTISPECIES: hypothetical protein [Bacillus cereus group]|uniref:Uncharacterized protein n=2 Tax=Bacillus cereus TaxID=1396 RepID=A0AA44Q8L4_BACCE|nr:MULTISPECIES: hypothetical protein [Bacillus cereus group]PFA14400.1 hypothetical protein CN373_23950 [Bacillus cereus]PFN00608.1 hypothetical protein COJ55_24770 [Bacillus cereus]PFO80094.1 hypothetical protein COJ77_18660 [Bacillus cereus]PFR27698.1 hypothetical protein COK19_09735 [Bacillus cereus]PFR98621.1 hypothetical protein COK38_18860 [Bacillus cereus]